MGYLSLGEKERCLDWLPSRYEVGLVINLKGRVWRRCRILAHGKVGTCFYGEHGMDKTSWLVD